MTLYQIPAFCSRFCVETISIYDFEHEPSLCASLDIIVFHSAPCRVEPGNPVDYLALYGELVTTDGLYTAKKMVCDKGTVYDHLAASSILYGLMSMPGLMIYYVFCFRCWITLIWRASRCFRCLKIGCQFSCSHICASPVFRMQHSLLWYDVIVILLSSFGAPPCILPEFYNVP